MLGHASVAITLDRYGHLYPGDVHQYVDRLGEAALVARADWLRTAGTLDGGRVTSQVRGSHGLTWGNATRGAVAQPVRAADS